MPVRLRDANKLAKAVVDMATGETRNDSHDRLSRRAVGGHARAAKLSAEQRREIARKSSEARWTDFRA